jgi:hypothetical protein
MNEDFLVLFCKKEPLARGVGGEPARQTIKRVLF